MTTAITLEELEGSAERDLGASQWRTIDQARIDRFADATDDHQWIHCDPEAAAKGPFGTTIAHGYLTLCLVPSMLGEVMKVSDSPMGINYGTEKLRFTSPVPVGSRIRLHAKLLRAERRGLGVVFHIGIQVEIEGQEKPAVVGEIAFLAAGAPDA
ncbi:MAG TPA: MaoC family dehydratase [Acidimicrobiales bacterium]|nr:MaoC family dehydratase [Acidimicrobiales bacterium]